MGHFRGEKKLVLLLSQHRYADAESLSRDLIDIFPMENGCKYYLAHALRLQGKLDEADSVADILLADDPANPEFIELKASVDMDQERHVDAEKKLLDLLSAEHIKDHYYLMLAQIKFKQNNYDKALVFVEQALELDAENIDALNMRSALSAIVGENDLGEQVQEALSIDPNNAYAIANHGTQLLEAGKVKEALERYKEALSIEPENPLAQHGLIEAMKSIFWPYKLLYKYSRFMQRLSGQQSWGVIIGLYLLYRFMLKTAQSNPALKLILYPIVGIMLLMFLSTWILNPVMNCALLFHPYGKLLLDEDEKKSAMLTGVALLLALVSLPLWYFFGTKFMMVSLTFFMLSIPLGTMYAISGQYKGQALRAGQGVVTLGLVSIALRLLTSSGGFFMIFVLALFVYQLMMNNWMIKTQGRVFED